MCVLPSAHLQSCRQHQFHQLETRIFFIYLYHSSKKAKAGPGSDDQRDHPPVETNSIAFEHQSSFFLSHIENQRIIYI